MTARGAFLRLALARDSTHNRRRRGRSVCRAKHSPAGLEQENNGVAIDKSLKRKGRLVRSRNVLTREERIEQMKREETWIAGRSPLGLPKTRVVKLAAKKKKKAKEEKTEEGAAAPAAGTAATPAAPAPAAKPAAKPGGKGGKG